MPAKPPQSPRILNKKARFEYEILESVEAGIALTGSEVKSLRAGQATLDGAYARISENEAWLIEANIAPYPMAGIAQHAPKRPRKLLLHRREIKKLLGKVTQKGLTIVPLDMHFSDRGLIKVTIALVRGKQKSDKRSSIKEREVKREMSRAMKRR